MADAFADSFILQAAESDLAVRLTPHGGAIIEAHWRGTPVLRPYAGDRGAAFAVLKAASFPLVPFGNRLEGNAFDFDGVHHRIDRNLDWDAHYLHGDGWLGTWTVVARGPDTATLDFEHPARVGTPYAYSARQVFAVSGDRLDLTLSVTNRGAVALPFGIGHHPFFPMDAATTLTASVGSYWTEKAGWLPDEHRPLLPELDFSTAKPLPRHYVNNGLEGWNGTARIDWPSTRLALTMTADPVFGRAFLFVSDERFEPGFSHDYFCFEPMSHTAGGHLLPDLGGLTILAPGETLGGSVGFAVIAPA
jgi:aldose 1-epimerase